MNTKNNLDLNIQNSFTNEILARNKISFYFNHCINQKIEKIEGDENHIINDIFLDHNFENDIIKEQVKINDNFVSILCINCLKKVNIDEIDEHSNNCFEDENKNISINDFNIILINKKLNSIYDYLIEEKNKIKININESHNNLELKEHLYFISILTQKIEQILNIQSYNQLSLDKLEQISSNLNKLIQKFKSSTDKYTLLNKVKKLIEEKIKYYINNNNNKIEKIHKKFRNESNNNKKNRNKKVLCDNSIDEKITESETMENFDLKKIEKILDEKREPKLNNIEDIINEVKNKRLFLMEVLKVKYQKINNEKQGILIPPQMLWKEAIKNKIEKNNWTQFIYDELNNPKKYLKLKKFVKIK